MGYNPGTDAAARYPDWVVRHRPLGGLLEVLCHDRRVILIERNLLWPARRTALTHAIAHLDLGHSGLVDARGRKLEEYAADRLAAERLLPLEDLADVLSWALGPDEVADELAVTEHMVRTRVRGLTVAQKNFIERRIAAKEGAA